MYIFPFLMQMNSISDIGKEKRQRIPSLVRKEAMETENIEQQRTTIDCCFEKVASIYHLRTHRPTSPTTILWQHYHIIN